ncbi:glycine receptor subunit alpha-2-like [Saccostrea echinata]|uniref:glycine receptor subunit alpha-2-like n=1 Tax=Saccostrea echinata TaxID=191078 RepID=UPI002A80AE1B|nr:glycine receptor subunit alpha-2-like [Saccostrea echinata]
MLDLCCIVLLLFFQNGDLQPLNNTKSTTLGGKEQKIIDDLLSHYDKRVSPTDAVGEGPVLDTVQLYILSLDSSGDSSMDFKMSFFLRQRWKDVRLSHNFSGISVLELHHSAIEAVWVPDIYFVNEETAHFHSVSVPNKMLNIYPDGEVSYSVRVTGTYACHMDLRKYPLDKQICSVSIESYGHSTRSLLVRWKIPPVVLSRNIKMTQFTIVKTVPYTCDQQYMEHNYSCIKLDLHMTRMNGFYFIHMYVPSILIVMLSWISFWLDIEATAARVSLGILTVLAMTTQNNFTDIQHVSYVTAMNVWTAASLAFVFLAVVEYAYINVHTRKHIRKTMTNATSTISMNTTNHKINNNIITIPNVEAKSIQGSGKKYILNNMDVDNKRGRRVDRYARFAFPICYILFNIVYWSFYMVWEPVKDTAP